MVELGLHRGSLRWPREQHMARERELARMGTQVKPGLCLTYNSEPLCVNPSTALTMLDVLSSLSAVDHLGQSLENLTRAYRKHVGLKYFREDWALLAKRRHSQQPWQGLYCRESKQT